MINQLLQHVETNFGIRKDVPQFEVGDTVDVHTRIVEGDKERIQVFTGTVIMKRGRGMKEPSPGRQIVNNGGVERISPTPPPFTGRVAPRRSGETRRAKLFYLRN